MFTYVVPGRSRCTRAPSEAGRPEPTFAMSARQNATFVFGLTVLPSALEEPVLHDAVKVPVVVHRAIRHRPDLQLVARPVGVEDALVGRHRVRVGEDGARDPIAVADDVQRPGAEVRDPGREREQELARLRSPDDVVIGEQLLVGHEFRKRAPAREASSSCTGIGSALLLRCLRPWLRPRLRARSAGRRAPGSRLDVASS